MLLRAFQRPIRLLSVAFAAFILLAGCGASNDDSMSSEGGNSGEAASEQQASDSDDMKKKDEGSEGMEKKEGKMMEGAKETELDDFYFEPKKITIQQGEKAKLTLKNEGDAEHTFTVEELGVDVEIEPGETKTITITGKKPGTYMLICEYHKDKGMTGKIIVKK
ncbi:MAG TPA: cupredoxin domain-containing protein [Bacillales bacterium]|nr:cupredoxin domain-containing protein [Bacillales bacterium]